MKEFIFLYYSILTLLILSCSSINEAEHFNKLASDPESKPDEVIKSLDIKQGMVIGDLGAGGGYYTFRFARETGPKGLVYAIDISDAYLKMIEDTIKKENIGNIKTVLASCDNSNLPENSADIIFIRNVFHDISDPTGYFVRLSSRLKSGGRVAIIDYKSGMVYRISGHFIREEIILDKMQKAGYVLYKKYDFLQNQSFNIFIRKQK